MDAIVKFPIGYPPEISEFAKTAPPLSPAPVLQEDVSSVAPLGRRRRSRRNYWIRFEPSDFVRYPRYRPMPYLKEMHLIRQAQQGDQAAREEIWVRNTSMAYSIVNQFHIPIHLLSDAIQEGILGLNRAIDKYEIERFTAFSTYAWYWVYQHISRFLDNHRHFVRIPPHVVRRYYSYTRNPSPDLAETAPEIAVFQKIDRVIRPVPLQDCPAESLPAYLDNRAIDSLDHAVLYRRMAEILPSRERFILKHRFGLKGKKPKTLDSIGRKLGVTRERVRQIEARAIERLRNHLPPGFDPNAPPPPIRRVDPEPLPLKVWQSVPPTTSPPTRPIAPLSPRQVDEFLLREFKHYPFRQANAVIYFYGLMRTPPLPLTEIADLLDLSPIKTWIALRNGRDKLLLALKRSQHPEIAALHRQIASDTSYRACLDTESQQYESVQRIPR